MVGILETLEAIVKVVDPSGNDPSFDLSRCPKCDSSNVIFEGTNVDEYGASQRFYCQNCDAAGHIQYTYTGHWVDGGDEGDGKLVLVPPKPER